MLGIVHDEASRAYPHTKMGTRAVINDEVNGRPVLLVFDEEGQMALPFDRKVEETVHTFTLVGEQEFPFVVSDEETGSLWDLSGRAVEGPMEGAQLEPIATYTAMWFAWASFHRGTEIYTPETTILSN